MAAQRLFARFAVLNPGARRHQVLALQLSSLIRFQGKSEFASSGSSIHAQRRRRVR
jgi:hypothetical protein